jgi:hypothetical protein
MFGTNESQTRKFDDQDKAIVSGSQPDTDQPTRRLDQRQTEDTSYDSDWIHIESNYWNARSFLKDELGLSDSIVELTSTLWKLEDLFSFIAKFGRLPRITHNISGIT